LSFLLLCGTLIPCDARDATLKIYLNPFDQRMERR
jgi:hypothetical protein